MKKILHLTLCKEWFELISSRKKTTEYREIKPYWITRLEGKEYDEIHFKNGYATDAPFMRVEWKGMTIGKWKDEDHFAIKLGKILEVKNYPI